jgi:hypothetical protein
MEECSAAGAGAQRALPAAVCGTSCVLVALDVLHVGSPWLAIGIVTAATLLGFLGRRIVRRPRATDPEER